MMPQSERQPPEILQEEDVRFDGGPHIGDNLPKDKNADKLLNLRRFNLGSSLLGWCIFLMMVCICLSIWNPENELIKNGFEAFKLIVMTILGYMFGSNAKNE